MDSSRKEPINSRVDDLGYTPRNSMEPTDERVYSPDSNYKGHIMDLPKESIPLPVRVLQKLLVMAVFALVIFSCFFAFNASRIRRSQEVVTELTNKITNSNPYEYNNVMDNQNFVLSDSAIDTLEYNLKSFYTKTGIQPYVKVFPPMEDVVTDSEKDEYLATWFNDYIHDSKGLIYGYFLNDDFSEKGYSAVFVGSDASDVFTTEYVDSFMKELNQVWNNYYPDNFSSLVFHTFSATLTNSGLRTEMWWIVVLGTLFFLVFFLASMYITMGRYYGIEVQGHSTPKGDEAQGASKTISGRMLMKTFEVSTEEDLQKALEDYYASHGVDKELDNINDK